MTHVYTTDNRKIIPAYLATSKHWPVRQFLYEVQVTRDYTPTFRYHRYCTLAPSGCILNKWYLAKEVG